MEIYETDKNSSVYTIKIKHDNGAEETREVDADAIDASNCSIVDLFAKMKHLEKNGKCESSLLEFAVSRLYMEYRTPGADGNTKINFKGWFEQQLELEKSQGNSRYSYSLERLLSCL